MNNQSGTVKMYSEKMCKSQTVQVKAPEIRIGGSIKFYDKQKDFGYGYGFEKLCKLSSDGSGEIREGFHSYLHKHDAVSLVSKFKTGHFVKTCIIPKGAEYCMGEHDDIVSTHIIVFRDDKSYKRYKKFRRFMWFFYLITRKLKK